MISGKYTVISIDNDITAEFGLSYSNQILTSYILFRERGRYSELQNIGKTTLKDEPDEDELKRASTILDQAERIKADKEYGRKIAEKYYNDLEI